MLISYIFDAFKNLASLTGLPFFIVLMGFFIVTVELFLLGVIMLFAVWRIRKEIIDLNRKIDSFARPPEKEPEKEAEREIEAASEKESEKEIEAASEKETEKKKYSYKWK
jgi:flagellar biosynthesis component FlhA